MKQQVKLLVVILAIGAVLQAFGGYDGSKGHQPTPPTPKCNDDGGPGP